MLNEEAKEHVRAFWDEAPCGTRELSDVADELKKYEILARERYRREPFIPKFARFQEAQGLELLEVGVGAGSDHLRFARCGANCTGLDLTEAAIKTTAARLAAEGLKSHLVQGDAEALPFDDCSFDRVYSWGVIHHTPDTSRAAREILRVLRPGGRFCVMVYNRYSLLSAQSWLIYGLLRGRPWRTISEILAQHVESPGTRAYTYGEAAQLFSSARQVQVETVVTPYDMRCGRRRFLPPATWRLVPPRLGWFHVITGER